MTWVNDYGDVGAVLVTQPEAIWTHDGAHCVERSDGSSSVVLPLWTADESPSDLSAEFEITAGGSVEVTDVHVL